MSDKNIQVGDEVSWNWAGGHPTGKVAEIKTSGKLEIESKGKRVHKDADESNPAVHVERSGSDVVKRASELSKLPRGGGDGDEGAEVEEMVAQGGGEEGEAAGEGAMQGVSEKEATGETVVPESGEGGEGSGGVEAEERPADEKPKRGGRRGTGRGKRTSAETRKRQSEAGKKGAAARKAKAGERERRKAVDEAAASTVGEKREAAEEGKAEKEVKKAKAR